MFCGCLCQGLFTAPTLQPAAITVVMMSCTDHSNPSLQALCLETLLLLVCTKPVEPSIDHNVVLFENVSMSFHCHWRPHTATVVTPFRVRRTHQLLCQCFAPTELNVAGVLFCLALAFPCLFRKGYMCHG